MENEQDHANDDRNNFLYICDICGQNDLSDMGMQLHLATTHGDDAVCLFCDLKGVTHEEMTIHINSVHFGDNVFMTESRNMDVEQNCDLCTLMKEKDCVFSDIKDAVGSNKQCEVKMSVDELKIKAACIEVDSRISSNKCDSCVCNEEAFMGKVEATKLGIVSNASNPLSSTENTVQLAGPNIHVQRLLKNQSNFIPETEMEGNLLCPFCDFVTNDENAVERHFAVDHSDKFLAEKPNEDSFGTHRKTPLVCPVCGLIFHEFGLLQLHVDGHFREDFQTNGGAETMMHDTMQSENEVQMIECSQQLEADQQVLNSSVMADCSKPTSEKVGFENCKSGQLVACFPSVLDIDDRSSSTEGVIEKLLSHYSKSHDIRQFWLCSNMDHFSTGADRGWGCGYRNFQMMFSCLAKCSMYRTEVFHGVSTIPSLQKIQSLLEDAWKMGFDQAGSRQFQGEVLNTKKWIGATEVVTVLSSLQIRSSLVDFHKSTGSNGTHPLLFEWIKHYFQTPEPFKLPLYFQHQGHSRTIIGMEEHHDGSLMLLAFDPGVPHTMMKKYLQMNYTAHLLKCLRKSVTDFKHKQYQIVAVHGIMDKSEMEELKILKSIRIP